MREENFVSSWLREDGKEKEEITMEIGKETKEGMGKKRRREEEKDENETESVKRRCVGSVSVEAFDIFSQERDMESCGGLSWGTFWRSLRTCLIVSLRLGWTCLWCLM